MLIPKARLACGMGPAQITAGVYFMLSWAVTFFIVALIAAVLGFSGVAVAAAGIAKILFFIFLILFLFSLVAHLSRRI
jgi:uncharacterized membrane protein YtjA (UPF0391 family)